MKIESSLRFKENLGNQKESLRLELWVRKSVTSAEGITTPLARPKMVPQIKIKNENENMLKCFKIL